MEGKKTGLILFVLFFVATVLAAGQKSEIYNAYVNGKMGDWKIIIDKMSSGDDRSDAFVAGLLNYQYGYIGWCISTGRKDEAAKYLDLAWKNATTLEKRGSMLSDVNAYKSALYGFRIGLNNLKAPFAGPKSVACAEKAIKLDNKNPNGYIQYANALYYMPESFGGSKSAAIDNYLAAERLMESKAEEIKEDWNYLGLLAIIGKAYQETGNNVAAKEYYERILKIEPRFTWVRDELYPGLLKIMK